MAPRYLCWETTGSLYPLPEGVRSCRRTVSPTRQRLRRLHLVSKLNGRESSMTDLSVLIIIRASSKTSMR